MLLSLEWVCLLNPKPNKTEDIKTENDVINYAWKIYFSVIWLDTAVSGLIEKPLSVLFLSGLMVQLF